MKQTPYKHEVNELQTCLTSVPCKPLKVQSQSPQYEFCEQLCTLLPRSRQALRKRGDLGLSVQVKVTERDEGQPCVCAACQVVVLLGLCASV